VAQSLLGLLDLSVVTDRLVAMLTNARDNSPLAPLPFTIKISGSAPDSVRANGDCQLSLYLFHVAADRYQRNSPVTPPRLPPPFPFNPRAQTQVPPVPAHPLSLDLYYLLTAFAGREYVQEQQAMSIALKCFHENPFVRTNVVIGGDTVPEEFCLTMEIESADELSRIWQAASPPARLSVVYKVSVVFITPEEPARPIAPGVEEISLVAAPVSLPFASTGAVATTFRRVSYVAPDLSTRSFDQSPATVAAGERVLLIGDGLNQPTSNQVFLLAADGSEFEVTPWVVANPPAPASPLETKSRIVLDLPPTVAALPAPGAALANTPPAGVYQLRVGNATDRSNATPVSIAAKLTVPAGPPAPVLTPVAGVFTVNGIGFGGSVEVLIGGVRLNQSGGAPGAGEFGINPAGTVVTFQLPAGLPNGVHAVRVRVNQVESTPTWWVQLP
jgi:hypothetical protein